MTTPFRPAIELLTMYAEYHRDRRNIATHLLGVPMIVFALGVLLSHPRFALAGWVLSPAWLVFGTVALWYVTRGEFLLGATTSLVVGALVLLAHRVPAAGTLTWLAWGLGFFVLGWVFQFIGHYYEGRKPAFADDLVGLIVGPVFVTLELLAGLGLFRSVIAQIERHAGPTMLRDLAHPA